MVDVGTQLYLQYLQGNSENLSQLVQMYSDGLVRFCYCFVRDSALSEDIMEDTFASIIVSRKHFSPKATFKTYLYKIARNKCIDHLRFNKKFVPLADVENVLGFNDVDESVSQKETKQALYKCLQQLPQQYRDVLQLCYLEDFSVAEICKVMRKNTKQVYNLLARAKSALKNLLVKEEIFL
ncbi:MAG: RNA polymerase sigma factor [Candidatus Fimimonas sp.]